MPWILQSGPMFSRASPERRALALMTRAPAPLGAPPRHRFRFRVVRRPDPHGAIVPRGGCPAAARVRGCVATHAGAAPVPALTNASRERPSAKRDEHHI